MLRIRRPAAIGAILVVVLALVLVGIGLTRGLGVAATPLFPSSGGTRLAMGEFYFKPGTVTLQAGQQVTIELVNEGAIEHEFMVGRDVHREDNRPEGYKHDFFAGVDIHYTIEGGELERKPGHGTEIELKPGGRAVLTFTVPADRVGEWEIGCFVPGHYEAGMKGKLVVVR